MFSDQSWPKDSKMFPSAIDVHNYLKAYTEKHKIDNHIRFNTRVDSVKLLDDGTWELDITNLKTQEVETVRFEFVMMASGLHSVPKWPEIANAGQFKGIQMHSSKFRLNNARLKSKRVIVVGMGFSGVDLCEKLVDHAKSIVNVFPRPYLVTPRLCAIKKGDHDCYTIVPIDLVLYKRVFGGLKSSGLSEEEVKKKLNEFLVQVFPYQTNKEISNPELFYDLDKKDQGLLVSLSDYYLEYVKGSGNYKIRFKTHN